MKRKFKKVQIFRHIVQLASFFLLPGLYMMAFSQLKDIYNMITKGNFNFIQAVPNMMELLSVILTTILVGRFFCGWFCSFGAYNDLLHGISKKVFKVNFKVNEKLDSALKYLKYVVLILIIVLAWIMGSTVLDSASVWDAFAQITDISLVISNYTVGLILLVIITVGSFFIERFFCRYLCPLGAIFTIFSKLSIFKIKMPKTNCGSCKACTTQCSMGIQLYKTNKVVGGECINCLKCTEVCPRKNAKANVFDNNVNALVASLIALIIFVGIYSFNNIADAAVSKNKSNTETSISTNLPKDVTNGIANEVTSNSPSGKYKDGTYTGSAEGFRGGTTEVSVTVKNGKIASIETISQQDTPRFYQRVESTIQQEILSSQSTNVDTISGATYSSRGIINAVKDALTKAQ